MRQLQNVKDFDTFVAESRQAKESAEEIIEIDEANNIEKDIESIKTSLEKKVKAKGSIENLGQKEISKLQDKYSEDKEALKKIAEFDKWCMNYEG